MKWHPDDQDFGGGWFAGKLWYVKESSQHQLTDMTVENTNVHVRNVGYPDGISIAPKKSSRFCGDNCPACKSEILEGSPSLTLMESSSSKKGFNQAHHYHLTPRCCKELRNRHIEVSKALDKSSYSNEFKRVVRETLKGVVFGDVTIDTSDDSCMNSIYSSCKTSDNDKTIDQDKLQRSIPVGDVGYKFRKEFLDGWFTGTVVTVLTEKSECLDTITFFVPH